MSKSSSSALVGLVRTTFKVSSSLPCLSEKSKFKESIALVVGVSWTVAVLGYFREILGLARERSFHSIFCSTTGWGVASPFWLRVEVFLVEQPDKTSIDTKTRRTAFCICG